MRAFDVATDDPILATMPGRYANALFELASEANKIDEVEGHLQNIGALLDESEDFRRLVRSPVFSAEEQERAVGAVLDQAGIGGLTGNFFRLIAKNRRLFAAPDMISAFMSLASQARGEVMAEVTSAHPLSDNQRSELQSTLKASIGKDVKLDARVDPSLLGGLIVKVGSRMIDTSLRTKLSQLKVGLTTAN